MNQTTQTALNQRISPPPEVVDSRIRQLEEKYDLLQFKVDGWCVWPLFRFEAAISLQDLPRPRPDGLSRRETYTLALKDLVKLIHLKKSHYVVKTTSSTRSEQKGGLYKDIYFDDLLLDMGSYFKIESVNGKTFFSREALIKSDLTTTAFDILAGRLSRIGGPGYISDIARRLYECLNQEPGFESFTFQGITRELLHFYWAKRLYAWLFKQVRPEYLFLADFGEFDLMAAAKEQRIKVVELQHGFIDRCNPGYSWSSYAHPYKACMPVPDLLFLYGDYWREELLTNGFWDEELRPVGSPRLDPYRKLTKMDKKGERECTILLTTQGFDVEKIISFISEFLKISREKLKVHLFIKLHPSREPDKQPYAATFCTNKNVQILLANEPPSTFELLTRANLHVSIYSSCHYEALALGIPTVILPFVGHESVLDLYKSGHAFLVQTPKDLLEIALHWRDHTVADEVGKRYFTPGALENIKKELGVL